MNRSRFLLLFATLSLAVCGAGGQVFGGKSHLQPSLVADTTHVVAGKPFTVAVRMKMDPGWHTYWQFPGDSGGKPRIEWKLPPGFTAGEIQWPLPKAYVDAGDLLTYIYEEEAALLVEITPPAELTSADVTLAADVHWLVCEQTCVPGDGGVSLNLPVGTTAQASNVTQFTEWRSKLPQANAPPFNATWGTSKPGVLEVALRGIPADTKVEFFPLPPEGATVEHPTVSAASPDGTRTITLPFAADAGLKQPWAGLITTQAPGQARRGWELNAAGTKVVASNASTSSVTTPAPSGPQKGLLAVLGLAFLGGLILNVMPCVLPVIALKIFGFVNQAGESRDRIFRLGLAFVAGVFVFFLTLAVIAISLGKSFNWGYQFQNPYILTALIALVFVFALNMIGVFEVTLGSGTASKLSELSNKEGYSGAFLHGMFTTLLGTSCTAPFLAPSLGYATTQPAGTVLLLFLAIATGMSLPYFLLTANPAWLRFVPKPGMWMERVKQILGFVVLAVAVWLLTVLYSTHGTDAGAGVTWYLLALGIAAWALGAFAQRRGVWALLVGTAVAGWFILVTPPLGASDDEASSGSTTVQVTKGGIPWQPWSEAVVTQATGAGQPVFVDFTADWCINCKFFERTVLETDEIRGAMKDKGILALKADWTKPNPAIREALGRFGRAGVPLFVYYAPGKSEPIVMDAISKSGLLELFSPLPNAPAAIAAAK